MTIPPRALESMTRDRGCVFLLTDYGSADELAGVLRATVARLAPGVCVVDLTHGVPAFDVRAGALALLRSVPHLGAGVVVGVVDPGVADERRAVALEVRSENGPRHLVGPDNGLLVWASEALGGVLEAVQLPALPGGRRSTFDGRDLFAPAAAALWNGVPIGDLGPAIDPASLTRLDDPRLSVAAGVIEAEVLWVDGFGNVQLSASASDADEADLGDRIEVVAGAMTVASRRVTSFAAVGPEDVGVIVDANGHLALVGDRSSAARTLGLDEADPVTLVAAPREHAEPSKPVGGGT
ncbi:MAG: S-adenosyl-l-methionine hydroxide adenosyltransferase family protein [Acidimicrobiales bacterium]